MQVIPCGDFPQILTLRPNIQYVREIIRTTTGNTQKEECVVPLMQLPQDDRFYRYQDTVNRDLPCVASHSVIVQRIAGRGCDYRYEVTENPLAELRDRRRDNTELARCDRATPASTQVCGATQGACRCGMNTEMGPVTY